MAELENDGFVEVGGGDTWNGKDSNLQVGDSITGEYIRHNENVGPNNADIYTLRTSKGDLGIWGSTVLNGRFEQINLGDIVRVTFQGESEKPGKFGKKFKLWKVESKENPAGTRNVAPVAETVTPSTDVHPNDLPY